MRSWRILLAALLATFTVGSVSQSCDFCRAEKGPTIIGDYDLAMAVVLVHVDQDPVQDLNGNFDTVAVIDQVLKPHSFLKDKKTITLKRRIDKGPSQILLFCDFYKDRLDAYRGVEAVPNGDMVKYVQGAIANKDRPIAERLRFAFDYLNSADLDVAVDAYREFAIADYKDYMTIAKSLPADKIAGWLTSDKTQPYRYGLYSSLLGHCGTAEHARMLRKKIDETIKNKGSEFEGLLVGYVMLNPKESWSFVEQLLRDGKEEFAVRLGCVRMARFLREQRPDLVPEKDLTKVVKLVLEYPDMADIGIEYLRKARAWECSDQVLDLFGKKTADKDFDNDFMKREILRFALRSPVTRAREFVQQQRTRDPEFVATTEELLKLES